MSASPDLALLITSQAEERSAAVLDELVHDLRQPAACIQVLVASCRSASIDADLLTWSLAMIEAQAAALLGIVAGILEAESAEHPETDAVECVTDAVGSVRLTGRCDVLVRAPGHPAGLLVQGPHVCLRRALVNILDNGTRAAGPDGRVLVTVKRTGHQVVVAVEDDGPGFGCVPVQHMLGLSSAVRIVRAAGGSLQIGSSASLGGAKVTITLLARGVPRDSTRNEPHDETPAV
jgi:signal transduction histidine kinase